MKGIRALRQRGGMEGHRRYLLLEFVFVSEGARASFFIANSADDRAVHAGFKVLESSINNTGRGGPLTYPLQTGTSGCTGTGCVVHESTPPARSIQSINLRSLSALPITDTELKVIAALAIIGLSNKPKTGYSTPAASGTPTAL